MTTNSTQNAYSQSSKQDTQCPTLEQHQKKNINRGEKQPFTSPTHTICRLHMSTYSGLLRHPTQNVVFVCAAKLSVDMCWIDAGDFWTGHTNTAYSPVQQRFTKLTLHTWNTYTVVYLNKYTSHTDTFERTNERVVDQHVEHAKFKHFHTLQATEAWWCCAFLSRIRRKVQWKRVYVFFFVSWKKKPPKNKNKKAQKKTKMNSYFLTMPGWSLGQFRGTMPSHAREKLFLKGCVHITLKINTQTHTSTHKHTQTHTNTHKHKHTNTHKHTQTHTNTHKHTQNTHKTHFNTQEKINNVHMHNEMMLRSLWDNSRRERSTWNMCPQWCHMHLPPIYVRAI